MGKLIKIKIKKNSFTYEKTNRKRNIMIKYVKKIETLRKLFKLILF